MALVTSLSPKLSKSTRSTKKSAQKLDDDVVESLGFNPSLPWALFDEKGTLSQINPRMEKLLGSTKLSLPLSREEIETLWPFQNEHESNVAHFRRMVMSPFSDASTRASLGLAKLKNFRIYVKKSGRNRLVVAEMLRTGDLMTDEGSRQELFRALSHEIRTSVTALKGYVDILEEKARGREISVYVHRLGPTLARLDSVVQRLEDFKVEMKVLSGRKAAKK